jgi:hypothetical protein
MPQGVPVAAHEAPLHAGLGGGHEGWIVPEEAELTVPALGLHGVGAVPCLDPERGQSPGSMSDTLI